MLDVFLTYAIGTVLYAGLCFGLFALSCLAFDSDADYGSTANAHEDDGGEELTGGQVAQRGFLRGAVFEDTAFSRQDGNRAANWID